MSRRTKKPEKSSPLRGVNAACAKFIRTELIDGDISPEEGEREATARETFARDIARASTKISTLREKETFDDWEENIRVELEQAFDRWMELEGDSYEDVPRLDCAEFESSVDLDGLTNELFDIVGDEASIAMISMDKMTDLERKERETVELASPNQHRMNRRRSSVEFSAWLASITDLEPEIDSTRPLA
ncbi:unnamed product [Ostreococcus tauri]|uniref:Unnamed product n=1 Tax=Ostreococcus tauri TaxID=70448 RepID=Q01B85_OSTTA|nr:unnamed product [Ostreococcus tauri]CAL51561.1 unnamed product [Ostreococcus tauri]|eukprot:XP_003078681.1 unnamed product [Ostreococcus tauri]